jgi:pSer/pThr/pTyr-binding forkhead associated (FHA) protein
MSAPSLVVRVAGEDPRVVRLNGNRVRLGRSDECEILVDQDGVSRTHAVFFRAGAEFVLEDLGSRNGTFVNGNRIERHTLHDGDRIQIAPSAEVEFRWSAEPPATESHRNRRGSLAEVTYRLVPLEAPGSAAIPIRSRVTTVGREQAAITIPDSSVSKLHARLDWDSDGLFVTDLKSRNGTRVNGSSVFRGALSDGDIVEFGDLRFRVDVRKEFAWRRLAKVAGAVVILAIGAVVAIQGWDWLDDFTRVSREKSRVRQQAVASVERGIAAYREGDVDFAKNYLTYAADLMTLSDLTPPGSSLRAPNELFRPVLEELPEDERTFDFARVFDSSTLDAERQKEIDAMTREEFIRYQCELIAVELGQSRDVPAGFVAQVSQSITYMTQNGGFQTTLNRSRTLHPRLVAILRESSLPETFCYVAWVESSLQPTIRSNKGAVGLWQFIPSTAVKYGLQVGANRDERTDVDKSTRAAASYIGDLILWFGREQFMCALASYNRGEQGVRNAMSKIPDPMMESSHKFWYLVENRLLPEETRQYVPRIFAARIIAGSPERFGLSKT